MDRAEGVREGGGGRAGGVRVCCSDLEEADDADAVLHAVLVQQLPVPGVQVDVLEDVLVDDQREAAALLVRQCGHVALAGRDLSAVLKSARL